ncbi:formate/nitrite transporter family protein [Halomonas sp. THAF12]|uniref:formate/nitrite transporter family protein n=1 Tax=Halomonas sp. B23F22_10 TaxID=3459515 RepID=UPI00373E04D5
MNKAPLFGDAYQPREIAHRVTRMGVVKARADTLTLGVLAVLAGAFISLGALFFAVVITGSDLGFGVTRLLGGLSFSLGLVLVVVAGAELFTGNNLLAMAWASGEIRGRELLRNWALVYLGNVVGCLGTVGLALLADLPSLDGGALGETLIGIATAKASLSPLAAFARGILCNVLVCLAVWLAMGGRSVGDRILAILLPITAFVALGFEHSVANWCFLPLGWWLAPESVSVDGAALNLALVTAGNVIGGSLLVAGVYWLAYLRSPEDGGAPTSTAEGEEDNDRTPR